MVAKPLKIPHVLTVHGSDAFALQSKLLAPFKRFALGHADAVTVNSSATLAKVREIAPKIPEPHRVPMGVAIPLDPANSTEVKRLRTLYRHGEGPLLIFVGRLVEEKGIEDFIRAVDLLSRHLPDVSALIAGEGPERKKLEAICKDLGMGERITFTGWVDPARVPFLLASGDIFVGPSRQAADGTTEAQGLTFLESMAAKTPVIATKLGGISETVIHGETGLLVGERSPDEIADAVLKLTLNPDYAHQLAQNGYFKVVNNFSREYSAETFSELFKRKIKEGKKVKSVKS